MSSGRKPRTSGGATNASRIYQQSCSPCFQHQGTPQAHPCGATTGNVVLHGRNLQEDRINSGRHQWHGRSCAPLVSSAACDFARESGFVVQGEFFKMVERTEEQIW